MWSMLFPWLNKPSAAQTEADRQFLERLRNSPARFTIKSDLLGVRVEVDPASIEDRMRSLQAQARKNLR